MNEFLSRARRLFVTTIAVGFCAFGTAGVRAQDLKIRIGHFPNVTHAQALVARNLERQGRNWYADRLGPKIKVEWYAYNAGPSAMEAIFAESIDLTYVGPNPAINAYARSGGREIRIVAGSVNGGSALVVQPYESLAAAADFRGKRIATPQFGNTQDVAARAWLSAGGLRITQAGGDAQVVPTANPEQLSLFKTGQLDAVWTVEPWVSRLEMEAGGKILVEEKEAVTTVLVARAAFLSEHRDLVRRFVDGHRDLSDWIKRHPSDAQRMILDELKASFRVSMSPELIARAWARMAVTSEISPSALQTFVTKAQQVGFLREMPELSRLIEVP
ncbi:putative aliphatic sulfonates-binding protein [Ensifer psoraleae]|uniref:ABC transporter substrate-binding protein n=1 Tax=Sinorhizobium psoraleae TaxID=520838 RepID=UPI00156A62FC|nr:ABC transporter substrate-binding protein [Sinorhizobium psoraleae]NRP74842.1 putative aliphatic sulfonates-binding protein [Sinorhizobium psoraleae]